MKNNRPRCFIHAKYGPPQPVDTLRFVLVNPDKNAVSALWSVIPHTNRGKQDIFVTMTGLKGYGKFSFHKDVLNNSWLSEARDKLISNDIIDGASRIMQSVPIGPLPWHGMTVRFSQALLRIDGYSLDDVDGTVIAIEAPSDGQVLEIGFVLAAGGAVSVKGAEFSIGEVGSAGRTLLLVGRYVERDVVAEKKALNDKFAGTPVPQKVADKIEPNANLAMHLFGEENGAIVVTEVHNVKYTTPI